MRSKVKTAFRHLSNIPGWRTNRRIVVLESDDWGTIRMPSVKVRESLEAKGLDLSSVYNRYDALATPRDLMSLFEVLQSVKDKNNNSAVITAVSLVANPDFDKIRESGFQQYFYEPFPVTLARYQREASIDLWKEGIKAGIFCPEFHGREHINVLQWLRALQKGDTSTMIAFDHRMWEFGSNSQHGYLAAFDLMFPQDIEYQKEVIREGLDMFFDLHGYHARLMVPPNGPFNGKLESVLSEKGIELISTPKVHKEPQGNGETRKRYFWLGKHNRFHQFYITRNAAFEPAQAGSGCVESCMKDIDIAFRWNKPAIISTHRVNYIGAIDESNRDKGLSMLKELLKGIVKKWPDVEFMTSVDLGNLIKNNHPER